MYEKTLSDELKRKQYDTYGSAGPGASGTGQQYWRGGATVDPEELFRKIFGEFAGGRGFGDLNSIFEQAPEVRQTATTIPHWCLFFNKLPQSEPSLSLSLYLSLSLSLSP